jgi:RimJ/RimL family protein N-acetyltransferase
MLPGIMTTVKTRLNKFNRENYASLIAWVETEEDLMQFAGPLLKFPLTPQQLDASLSDKNRIAFTVVDDETNLTIGHAETYLTENTVKIGRILIGSKALRGKGLGQQIIEMLLDFSFTNFDRTVVELNVFDWNISAIKCYEKAGFTINPGKTLERKVKDKTWTALNMTIDKKRYEQIRNHLKTNQTY